MQGLDVRHVGELRPISALERPVADDAGATVVLPEDLGWT
jgi:hypothetical protein